MSEVTHWPFPLPDQLLDVLGYPRIVAALDSPALRAQLAELLHREGIDPDVAPPSGPRRWVLLFWEPGGDELAFSDGVHSGAGQLDHAPWLAYVDTAPISSWLAQQQIDLGLSDGPATHALIVDAESNTAWVAPIALAHRIVRRQSLEPES